MPVEAVGVLDRSCGRNQVPQYQNTPYILPGIQDLYIRYTRTFDKFPHKSNKEETNLGKVKIYLEKTDVMPK